MSEPVERSANSPAPSRFGWHVGASHVVRARLLGLLAGRTPSQVVVAAPAGCGKTVLLQQILAATPGAVLVDPTGVGTIDELAALVARCAAEHPMVLIDEVERLQARFGDGVVGHLVRSSDVPLVLAGRCPIEQFVAAAPLASTIGERELRLQADELVRLAAQEGWGLAPDELLDIHDHTGGWPVGVRWAAASRLDRFHSAASGGTLGDYLESEVLRQLPAAFAAHLEQVALLAPVSPEFIDEVVGGDSSSLALFRSSALAGVPLLHVLSSPGVQLDLWPQMRDLLSIRIRTRDPRRWASLLEAASRLAVRGGDLATGFRYLHELGDAAAARQFIYRHAASCALNGDVATVKAWLAPYSLDDVRSHPMLAIAQAVVCAVEFTVGEIPFWLEIAEVAHDDHVPPDLPTTAAAAAELRQAFGFSAEYPSDPTSPYAEQSPWRAFGHLRRAGREHGTGDLSAAVLTLEEIAPLTRPYRFLELQRLASLALVASDAGQDEVGRRTHRRLLELRDSSRYLSHPTLYAVDAALAVEAMRREDRDAAAQCLQLGAANLEQARGLFAPRRLAAAVALGQVAVWLGDEPAVAAMQAIGDELMPLFPDFAFHEQKLAAIRDRQAAPGRRAPVVHGLTPAELRVARRLSSYHTIAEIASELYVAPETVKSQIKSIYRKMGVNRRRAAVELLARLEPDAPPA